MKRLSNLNPSILLLCDLIKQTVSTNNFISAARFIPNCQIKMQPILPDIHYFCFLYLRIKTLEESILFNYFFLLHHPYFLFNFILCIKCVISYQIVMPNTVNDSVSKTKLFQLLKEQFSNDTLSTLQRKHFSDKLGNLLSFSCPFINTTHLPLLLLS